MSDVFMREVECSNCGALTRHHSSILERIAALQSWWRQDALYINYACPECNLLTLSPVVPQGKIFQGVDLSKFPDDLTDWIVTLECEGKGCESRVILLGAVKRELGSEVSLLEGMNRWRIHNAQCQSNFAPASQLRLVHAEKLPHE